ncbi:serine/threonine protein kinase, partial [Streptomyces longispororuber]|nr:serine/threonine protein kinase [Streptomyces longispororuber]
AVQGSWGHTPPYGPGVLPLGSPQQEPRRGRSTAALIAVALIVAIGAGGSVYALMKDDGSSPTAQENKQTPASASAPVSPAPSTQGQDPSTPDTSSAPAETPQSAAGEIPAKFLGTWSGAIDNATGHHPRQITIQQGEPGDTVLSMTADGPQKDGQPYHCLFEGELTSATDSTLRIGGTDPVIAEPASACTPGKPSTVTILPSGQLRRVMTGLDGKTQTLTYDRSG